MYDLNAQLTCGQAAQLVGVSKQLINWWHTAGNLEPIAGTRPRLYRLGDVLAAERTTRESPNSHRAA